MDAPNNSPKQQLLQCVVALAIADAARSLSALQEATGFHRSKLGRIRWGRHAVTSEEAEIIFRALDMPVGRLSLFDRLGDDGVVSAEDLACLALFSRRLAAFTGHPGKPGSTLDIELAGACLQDLDRLIADRDINRGEDDILGSPSFRRSCSG